MNMFNLYTILCLWSSVTTVKTESHSLWTYATFILGETQFPEFSAVIVLDNDVQVGYYDSKVKRFVFRGDQALEHYIDADDHSDAVKLFEDMHRMMWMRTVFLKHHYNHTSGVHAEQGQLGCELHENDVPGMIMARTAFNGVKGDELLFNVQLKSFQSQFQCRWPGMKNPDVETLRGMFSYFYYPICIRALRKCLKITKSHPRNKVKPDIHVFLKTIPDSGWAKVTCLATGFYPRHINLTLLRDGQPVPDHQITGGGLLPNADETYQMRKSLDVTAKELRNKHQYTCTAEHLSLPNRSLDVSLDYGHDNDYMQYPLIVIAVLMVVCLIGLVMCVRRAKQSGSSFKHFGSLQSNYTATPGTDENSEDTPS